MHTENFYLLLCGDSVLTDENTMQITSANMTFKDAFFKQSISMKQMSVLQVRLVVELLWPLFLFFILVGVRATNKPIHKGQCKYNRFILHIK